MVHVYVLEYSSIRVRTRVRAGDKGSGDFRHPEQNSSFWKTVLLLSPQTFRPSDADDNDAVCNNITRTTTRCSSTREAASKQALLCESANSSARYAVCLRRFVVGQGERDRRCCRACGMALPPCAGSPARPKNIAASS